MIMIKKSAGILLLTTVISVGFALPVSAHFCYNQDKPDNNGGTITLENMDKRVKFVGTDEKMVIAGGFVDPGIFGVEDYPDIYAHVMLPDQALFNGSEDHGVSIDLSAIPHE